MSLHGSYHVALICEASYSSSSHPSPGSPQLPEGLYQDRSRKMGGLHLPRFPPPSSKPSSSHSDRLLVSKQNERNKTTLSGYKQTKTNTNTPSAGFTQGPRCIAMSLVHCMDIVPAATCYVPRENMVSFVKGWVKIRK